LFGRQLILSRPPAKLAHVQAAEISGQGAFGSSDRIVRCRLEHQVVAQVLETQGRRRPAMTDIRWDRDLSAARDSNASLHDHEPYHEESRDAAWLVARSHSSPQMANPSRPGTTHRAR